MGNPFCYVQLHTTDPERAKRFYGELLEWSFEEAPADKPAYAEIQVGEGTAGGMLKCATPEMPSHWLPFVLVTDVQASVGKATELGATVVVQPTKVPGKGTYSVLVDPTGASVALWQPASMEGNSDGAG